jgi:hypothetical protein
MGMPLMMNMGGDAQMQMQHLGNVFYNLLNMVGNQNKD